jgi:hypothetical protein
VIVSTALEVIGRLLQSALKRVGMGLFDRFLGVGRNRLPHFGRQLEIGGIHVVIVPQ